MRRIEKLRLVWCPICGKVFKRKARKQRYCSKECVYRDPRLRKRSSEWMKKLNIMQKEQVKERMKKNNPMADPKVFQKMMETKRINGTLNVWLGERGGNGKYTSAQFLLASILGWPMEVAIVLGGDRPKGKRRIKGYPTNYKVDIGNEKLKIAIEVDGKMHHIKRVHFLDKKKERKLEELGWKVLRFTNEEVLNDLESVLKYIRLEIKNL